MDLVLEALKWYGIAWGISLIVCLVPGWISGGRLMSGPLRDLFFLDDSDVSTTWKNVLLVLGLVFFPVFILKHVLSLDNWGVPQLGRQILRAYVWVLCRKSAAVILRHSPLARTERVQRFAHQVAKEHLALNLLRHKEKYPRVWEFGAYLERLYNLPLLPMADDNEIVIAFDPGEAAIKIQGAWEELKSFGVSEVLASEMLDTLIDPNSPKSLGRQAQSTPISKVTSPPIPLKVLVSPPSFGLRSTFLGVNLLTTFYLQATLRATMQDAVKTVKMAALANTAS